MSIFNGQARLGKDPVLKTIGEGESQQKVCEFSARIVSLKKNKESGKYEDDKGFWADVTVWGKFAESTYTLYKKGNRVWIEEGQLTSDIWPKQVGDQTVDVPTFKIDTRIVFPWVGDIQSLTFKPKSTQSQTTPDDEPARHAIAESAA